jgi:tripartite ATP-independent transporter DctM subunit
MSPELLGIVGVLVLFALLASGLPIGFALGIVGVAGFAVIIGPQAAFTKLAVSSFHTVSSLELGSLPLFLLMAQVLFSAGISRDLYVLAARLIGHWRGGLAIATIGGCAGFGAISSSSLATAATMGMVSLPEMSARGYSPSLAAGSVAAGGTLGSMIPPSGMLIVYGVLTEQSIGKLFAAGVIPGLLQALFYVVAIAIFCRIRPAAGPPGPRYSWRERWEAARNIGDMLLLLLLVIGGLVAGLFTATESGAVGAVGAILLGTLRRRLSWRGFRDSVLQTLRTSGMIYAVLIGAFLFASFMAVSEIPDQLAAYVGGLEVSQWVVILCIVLSLFVLGSFLDAVAMMTLTLPVFFPVIEQLGLSPIWFGIIMVRLQETALITPPMGMNIFVVSGLRSDLPLPVVYRGVLPFLLADIPHILLLISIPAIALFLPGLM